MKRGIILLAFILFSYAAKSYWYYQPYPINAQIITIGTQSRVTCSVYDSVLNITQTFNGPWCSSQLTLYNDSIGMVVYTTIPPSTSSPYDIFRGAIVYDINNHAFSSIIDSCIQCYDRSAGLVDGFYFIRDEFSFPMYTNTYYYFDIKRSQWVSGSFNCSDDMTFATNYGTIAIWGDNNFGNIRTFFQNPAFNTTYMPGMTGAWADFFSPISLKDMIYVSDNAFHLLGYWVSSFSIIDPAFQWVSPQTGNASRVPGSPVASYNTVQWIDNNSGELNIESYDIQQHLWKNQSFTNYNPTSIKMDNLMYALTDTASSIVFYGVYDFNVHSWLTDSDTISGGVSSIAFVNNSLVISTNSGSLITRGYIDSTGWGNYNTSLQPRFFLGNYSSPSAGNLIYVKDYSIGAQSTFFDFGDGLSTSKKTDFHLYKVNGTYRTTAPVNYNVCLTATSPTGNLQLCHPISFPVAIENLNYNNNHLGVSIEFNSLYQSLSVVNQKGNKTKIEIIDLIGRSIFNKLINNKQYFLNTSFLRKGVYLVCAYDSAGAKAIKKIIIH